MTDIKYSPFSNYAYREKNFQDNSRKLPPPETIGYNPETEQIIRLDLRALDVSTIDLSKYPPDFILFDDLTTFPESSDFLPKDFDPKKVYEDGKNPGLGVRELHENGYTGKGVRVAIIDGALLGEHEEYRDQIVEYKQFDIDNGAPFEKADMHSTVASILAGKICGVLPDSKVHYYAANNSGQDRSLNATAFAEALNSLIDLNKTLPSDDKIQVVSISWGAMGAGHVKDHEKWNKAVERAKQEGLTVVSCALGGDYGLLFGCANRSINGDVDDVKNYSGPKFKNNFKENTIMVPSGQRTLSGPYSEKNYAHYTEASMSWATPFLAGMFAMARSVNKNISIKHFHEIALKTGEKSEKGTYIQPLKLIKYIENENNISKHLASGKVK